MIDLRYLITIFGAFVWLLPPIRNRGTEFFYLFLVYAVSDPIKIFAFYVFNVNAYILVIILNSLLITSLLKSKLNQIVLTAVSVIITMVFVSFNAPKFLYELVSTILHFALAIILLIKLTDRMALNKSLNLFLMLLLTYEVITVLKRIYQIIDPLYGNMSFYLGTIFQIMLGIMFVFINVNTKNIKLVKDE